MENGWWVDEKSVGRSVSRWVGGLVCAWAGRRVGGSVGGFEWASQCGYVGR